MFLQLEDYTGILNSLNPGIDFIFLFDNPCVHDGVREERLNLTKISSVYVGAQLDMQPTKIKHGVSYPYPHEIILDIGYEKYWHSKISVM